MSDPIPSTGPIIPDPIKLEKNLMSHTLFQVRVKKIGLAALIALGAALAAAAIVTISLASFGIVPLALAAGTAAACAGVAGITLWGRVTPQLPEHLKAFSQLVQSVGCEVLSFVTLGFLFPLNLERFDPKKEADIQKDQVPVLFIPGFLGSSNNWVYHRRRLQEEGYKNIFTVNLGSPLILIEEYAEKVQAKVEEIRKLTGRDDIILVGHSMGGLVAREYLYHHKNPHTYVRQIITLGTPLGGTKVAHLASWVSKCAKEMLPHSPLTTTLMEEANKDETTKYHHVGTKVDLIILPRKSATEAGERTQTETVTLEATPHAGYLFSDAAADIVVREVLKTNAAAKEILV